MSGSDLCWNNVPHAAGYQVKKTGGFFAEIAAEADHSTTDPGGGSGGRTCQHVGSVRPGVVVSVKALGRGRYRDSDWSNFNVLVATRRPTQRPTQRPPTAPPPTPVPPTPKPRQARLYTNLEFRYVSCSQGGQFGLCQERRQCSKVCWVDAPHICWNHRCSGWGRTGAFIPAALPGS